MNKFTVSDINPGMPDIRTIRVETQDIAHTEIITVNMHAVFCLARSYPVQIMAELAVDIPVAADAGIAGAAADEPGS